MAYLTTFLRRWAYAPACLLLVSATPLPAWEFSPTPICTLTHSEAGVDVTVTYDAARPEYRITLTTPDPWPAAPQFGLAFEGARSLAISTDRHELSADGRSLSVSDTGFGNVLDGLQFNDRALGASGQATAVFSLSDAAPAVAAFRACPAVATS